MYLLLEATATPTKLDVEALRQQSTAKLREALEHKY